MPGARLFALVFTVNVTVVPVDAEPEVEEGASQVGTPEIEKLTAPVVALSAYGDEEPASAP